MKKYKDKKRKYLTDFFYTYIYFKNISKENYTYIISLFIAILLPGEIFIKRLTPVEQFDCLYILEVHQMVFVYRVDQIRFVPTGGICVSRKPL